MKLSTIRKYIAIMDDVIESEDSSLRAYCFATGVNYNLFMEQMTKMRRLAAQYDGACLEAIQKYEKMRLKLMYHRDPINPTKPEYPMEIESSSEPIITQEEDPEINEKEVENYMDNIKLLN